METEVQTAFGYGKIAGIILVIVIGVVYFQIVRFMRKGLKSHSRAAQFKVGGKKFGDLTEKDESREERQGKRQVSLRDGRMFRRRFR